MCNENCGFKVGDEVVCVNNNDINRLTQGKTYIVRAVHSYYKAIFVINDNGYDEFFFCERFEKSTKAKSISELIKDKNTVESLRIDMFNSYIKAIKDAGGNFDFFVDSINKMTVAEMIDLLATNGVRFTFDKKGALK